MERLFIGAGVEGFDLAADRTGMGSKRGLIEIALGTRLVIEVAVAVDAAQESSGIPHLCLTSIGM